MADNFKFIKSTINLDESWYANELSVYSGSIQKTTGITVNIPETYIPNDGYDYELMIYGHLWTSSTSGQGTSLWVYAGEDRTGIGVSLLYSLPRTASSTLHCSNAMIPLVNGVRKLYLYNNTSYVCSSLQLVLAGYKRLGINI